MNAHMQAIQIKAFGGPEHLHLESLPIPSPKSEEVMIRVQYSGINRPDILQRKGYYPAPPGAPQDIPGLEVAGEVVACGDQVYEWKVGDKVCALVAGGGYAEFVVAHQGHCLPLGPMAVDEAAAIPETLFTVWYNLFQQPFLNPGDRFLVHGGSGGIGTMAVQLASYFGIEVFSTAGSDERCRKCEELGASQCLNYNSTDFSAVWEPQSIHGILDSIGGNYFEKNLKLLAPEGKLIYINCTGGRKVELDLLQLMKNRHHITGSTLRARDQKTKQAIRDALLQHIWMKFQQGDIKPIIHEILPAKEAARAHTLLESGSVFGKLLLKWY
jgi:NADPH2:quinone reductase